MKPYYSFALFVLLTAITYGQNVNLSNGVLFEGEPYLVVNPNNPDHLVVAWMGWAGAASRIKIKTRTSFDNGDSWSDTVELPHVISGYTSADCAIAFDSDGSVYISYIDSTGINTDPIEGGVYICKSIDNGLSFGVPVEVLNIDVDPEQLPIDRPWMAIDRSLGPNDGTIYITTMNVDGAIPDFHPYISISTDNGSSFEWNELDGENWLSGNAIPKPMPAPTVDGDGIFHAVYPSFVVSQNILPQFIIASSNNGGNDFSYNTVFSSATTGTGDPLPKAGYILRTNPANPAQLVFAYISNFNDDLDVFVRLSQDTGATWSTAIRVNDDPIGNDIMQDLVWIDFDNNGDLIVSWRDRRNGAPGTYETASEIWAAFLPAGSSTFEPNFQLTSKTVAYNNILASAGNDFMSIALENAIVHAVWGDPRNDILNIWYQRSLTDGTILGLQELNQEPKIAIFPNPTSKSVTISASNIVSYQLYDLGGSLLLEKMNVSNLDHMEVDMSPYSTGTYLLDVYDGERTVTFKVLKKD